MKAIVLICAVVAACLAVSCVAEEAKVEWPAVLKKVTEIRDLVGKTIIKITTVAEKDNPAVAKSLKPKIDEVVQQAQEVLGKVISALNTKTLTENDGKKLFAELQKIILAIQADTQGDLGKLSKGAMDEIHMTFLSAYGEANQMASDAFKLLRPKKN